MPHERFDARPENAHEIEVIPPPVELMLDAEAAKSAWPASLLENSEFREQTEARRNLIERIDAVIDRLPRADMTLEDALASGRMSETEITDLYGSLADLIADPDYERALLYMPFEFIPGNDTFPHAEQAAHAGEGLRKACLQAWESLLETYDVRANFVDGDVLDIASRVDDLPRVVKAAHLIPIFVEKGIITATDVIKRMIATDDDVLKRSIGEALPVLGDLGFIGAAEQAMMIVSSDPTVRRIGEEMRDGAEMGGAEIWGQKPSFVSISEKLADDYARINAMENDGSISEKRLAWLKDDARRKAIEASGNVIAQAIRTGSLEDVASFADADIAPEIQEAFVDGVRKAIEVAAERHDEEADRIYGRYREMLQGLWEHHVPAVQDMLAKTFSRLSARGIVTAKELASLGITIPTLEGPFSENLKSMERETDDIKTMIAAMESDPDVSRYVYPVVLVYGSRVKGYGKKDADIDVGVIIRPGTPPGERGGLQEKFKDIFAHRNIQGTVTEFWTEETEAGLSIYEPDGSSPQGLGEKYWTHVLFGSAWEGRDDAVQELREKLLVPYFSKTEETFHGRDARGLYLEEMERDALQYRLMHKGYDRFFPPYGGIHTAHADRIDGDSTFWDSGYRMKAIRLFAGQVFLPKLS